MKMDFRPDFVKKSFKHIEFDYKHMYAIPGVELTEPENKFGYMYDKMEYAYAITTHSSQGSQYPSVLYMHEEFSGDKEFLKKLLYTGITRAREYTTVVL
jgi:hypothetical protein